MAGADTLAPVIAQNAERARNAMAASRDASKRTSPIESPKNVGACSPDSAIGIEVPFRLPESIQQSDGSIRPRPSPPSESSDDDFHSIPSADDTVVVQ
jgi:hypothetical protein